MYSEIDDMLTPNDELMEPLKFWEIWLLKLLQLSPRIHRVLVVQFPQGFDPENPTADRESKVEYLNGLLDQS